MFILTSSPPSTNTTTTTAATTTTTTTSQQRQSSISAPITDEAVSASATTTTRSSNTAILSSSSPVTVITSTATSVVTPYSNTTRTTTTDLHHAITTAVVLSGSSSSSSSTFASSTPSASSSYSLPSSSSSFLPSSSVLWSTSNIHTTTLTTSATTTNTTSNSDSVGHFSANLSPSLACGQALADTTQSQQIQQKQQINKTRPGLLLHFQSSSVKRNPIAGIAVSVSSSDSEIVSTGNNSKGECSNQQVRLGVVSLANNSTATTFNSSSASASTATTPSFTAYHTAATPPPPPPTTTATGSCASLAPHTNTGTGSCKFTSASILSFYDTKELMSNDSKYKSYVAAVDKALKSFEYTSEWADLVSALSKLNRVLNNNIRYRAIPRRFIVGQRLAQCMHPLLPSGVHLKALETYDLIFKCIGQERLLAELTIYSNGLFPLLTYAAINVRPALLDLYERHLLPLGERLKPALDGFLISVLPCLEEGSDFFQRTDKLLLQVASGVGTAYFYSALWRCIMQNSSTRLPAISFITLHFNKKRSLAEQAHILGLCMQTLVRAICAALLDTNILVQRAILDLLLTCFPLHLNLMNEMQQAMASPVQPHAPTSHQSQRTTQQSQCQTSEQKKSPNKSGQSGANFSSSSSTTTTTSSQACIHRRHFKRSELVAIFTAALTVLLRRDLSLNRRLCAWFFGSDASSSSSSSNPSTTNASSSSATGSTTNVANSVFSKSSTAFLSSSAAIQHTGSPTTTSSSGGSSVSSSESKARRKKIAYFDNYARDLVLEAFKRCIINPILAITSILPASAITNSFISFTLPFPTTLGAQAPSTSSSPSTSTSSLLHLHSQYGHRQGSVHGNSSRPISYLSSSSSVGHDSYSSSSTFWPYRLLICILDQRDIANPIMETLCVDILRGLYHEFELLTNVIPPPLAVLASPSDELKECDKKDRTSSLSTNNCLSDSPISSASSLSLSTTDLAEYYRDEGQTNVAKLGSTVHDQQQTKTLHKVNNRSKTAAAHKTTTGANRHERQKRSSRRRLSGSSTSSKRTAISASAPTVAVVLNENSNKTEQASPQLQSNGSGGVDTVDRCVTGKKDALLASNTLDDKTSKPKLSSDEEEYFDINVLANKQKNNLNLFSNLRKNVRTKSATMIKKFQRPLHSRSSDSSTAAASTTATVAASSASTGNGMAPTSSATSQTSKMKAAMKTLPLVRQFKLKLSKHDEKQSKSKSSKKFLKKNHLKNQSGEAIRGGVPLDSVVARSVTPSMMCRDYDAEISGRDSIMAGDESDQLNEDAVFELPHHHYYWNPYYQQLDKYQRRELLKELDRVMHLLFTNVGVDFIWAKLAYIFQCAAEEAIALKKLLHLIVKKAKRNRSSLANAYDDEEDSSDEDEEDNDDQNVDDLDHHSNEFDQHSSSCTMSSPETEDESLCVDDQESDTVSHSSSLTWARSLAPSLLAEFIQDTISPNSSSSSTPYASPRVYSPTGSVSNIPAATSLKQKLLLGLANRCRHCGHSLSYTSPVQPVGTDSLTILEACTLVRFLLGDSRPYHLAQGNDLDEDPYTDTLTSALLTNSVSVSMNRCSALEPLAVDTANYHFLIQFSDHILQLMSKSAKSFTSVDLRASVELCLALCAKLKPAIMQTFVLRYRHTAIDSKNGNDVRKPSLNSWFSASGSSRKTRSSSTASSKKHLELVKEEEEEEQNKDGQRKQTSEDAKDISGSTSAAASGLPLDGLNDDDEQAFESKLTEVNDDLKIEQVVNGVLNFFVVFVESILIKNENVPCVENLHSKLSVSGDQEQCDQAKLSVTAQQMIRFYQDILCGDHQKHAQSRINVNRYGNTSEHLLKHQPPIAIRHQLLPIYEQLCELLVEVGTMPLLTSPCFILKKRTIGSLARLTTTSGQPFSSADLASVNVRWFIYLLVLSANRLSSCSHYHQLTEQLYMQDFRLSPLGAKSSVGARFFKPNSSTVHSNSVDQPNSNAMAHKTCCQLRHVAYTSLATILDLLTISRAYIMGPQNTRKPTAILHHSDVTLQELLPIPSFSEMNSFDMFPNTFVAKRLNFFPLIHPELLQHLYSGTSWFKLIAVRLWSNLSTHDSSIHHATAALLQQLHSISSDSSICEAVICDEMTGGQHYRSLVEQSQSSQPPPPTTYHYRSTILFPHQSNSMDRIYSSRSKFMLLFSLIRDIRFISERLALIVTALSSAAKADPDLESDTHSNDFDSASSTQHSLSTVITVKNADLDSFADLAKLEPTNFAELDLILRLTCSLSPVALCTTMKRHFDRPLFIMLDALSHRRTVIEHHASAADWLLSCLSPPDQLGTRSIISLPMFSTFSYTNPTDNSNNSSLAFANNHLAFGSGTDISRLLEPLFFILLDSNTSRLSVQNVNIQRYTRRHCMHGTCDDRLDHMFAHMNLYCDQSGMSNEFDLSSENSVHVDDQVDESKIYAISSTNGNVIYHVRRKPPLKSSPSNITDVHIGQNDLPNMNNENSGSAGIRPNRTLVTTSTPGSQKVVSTVVHSAQLGELPASYEQMLTPTNTDLKMKVVLNPFDFENSSSLATQNELDSSQLDYDATTPVNSASMDTKWNSSLSLDKKKKDSLIEQVVQQVVDDLICSVVELLDNERLDTDKSVNTPTDSPNKDFDTASSGPRFPGMASAAGKPFSSDSKFDQSSSTKIHISPLHMHLLLYERQYDTNRTIYALDTILNMIETWPTRVLHSMATTPLLSCNSLASSSALGPIFDGTRAAQIQALYIRHRNSILGRGFYHNVAESTTSTSRNIKLDKKHDDRSILRNISILELIVQICLQYLRSYYPSCPSTSNTNPTTSSEKSTGLDCLFSSLKSNQSCIDLESIYGNQRVRLMACEILQVVFSYLSSMIDTTATGTSSGSGSIGNNSSNSGSSISGSHTATGNGRHRRQLHESLTSLGFQLRPFVQYLHDMLLRCEVQRNVLQCLVTSVWHYEQKRKCSEAKSNPGEVKPAASITPVTKRKRSTSYLYPNVSSNNECDPAANAFINEILDYNDYPARSIQSSTVDTPDDDADGFHDEFEKCLLRLLEQVMILESRVSTTGGGGGSSSTTTSSYDFVHQAALDKVQRYQMELSELRFDPNISLAGQSVLHGAIQLALQQNFRRHIHSSWLSFVESSLPYAGRFLSRLVLCVINQLCRNLDSCTREIERFSSSGHLGQPSNMAPFNAKHLLITLQGITMLCSYCLLDRSQLEPLIPFLSDIFEDSEDEIQRSFGLSSFRKKKKSGRFDSDSANSDSMNNSTSGSSANASSGPIHIISSLFHNLMVIPNISSTSNSTSASGASNGGGNSDGGTDSGLLNDTLKPNLLEARKSVLGVLSRVIVSLFNTWCSLVVAEEVDDEMAADDLRQSLNTCCHYYLKFQRYAPSGEDSSPKRMRYKQSSCSLGWSSSAYTGWYIMGSSSSIRRCILTILSVISVSHGPSLMSSLAQVWCEIKDRHNPGKLNCLNGAIDLVIAPVSPQQNQLVRLIASLSSIFTLETLIQTIRSTLKSAQSNSVNVVTLGSSSRSTNVTSNPLDNLFLIEVSLLEFFLAYIRTCSGTALLNSWRSVLGLIKDGLLLNVTASIPCESIMPAIGSGSQQSGSSSSTSSQVVSINFQPLVNFHLLAILHEFVIAAPFVEERRAQKELQEVAQKLIEANVNVAGGRLYHSRWNFRRNFEVLPMNSAAQSPVSDLARVSPIISLDTHRSQMSDSSSLASPASGGNTFVSSIPNDDNISHEQQIAMKRNLFRSSASVSFQERRTQYPSSADTQSENLDYHLLHGHPLPSSTLSSASSDGIFSGLFSFGLPSTSSASGSSGDVAANSQALFYSYFCIKALYALSEFAAPILDVVYASEEKEKMIPLITNLMLYAVPYLKSHTEHNWPCFDACSRLLASLSGYQYTRKAWRRETLELLLDGSFFYMPAECLPAWRTIIDHLMTHDKNTFREFLARMSMAQSPSTALKIFVPSSTIRDQEAESRAQLVKRLAFILFCSEKDQYQRYMAEIQEKLIEIHRTSQSPMVQAQVLLAFRVIILRMSPQYLASLWPFIYTEMFQVFLNIEQLLLDYIRNNDQRFLNDSAAPSLSPSSSMQQPESLLLFGTDSGSVSGDTYNCGTSRSTPGSIHSQGKPVNMASSGTTRVEPKIPNAQLQLFLNACKLLDLAMLLPSDTLPQFQLHRWAFLGDSMSYLAMSSFDIAALIFSSDGSVRPSIDTVSTFSTDDQPSSILSFQSSGSESGPYSVAASEIGGSTADTISLHSSSTHDSGQCSLPPPTPLLLPPNSGQTRSSNSNSQHNCSTATSGPHFVPHIVFINSILNYLSDTPQSHHHHHHYHQQQQQQQQLSQAGTSSCYTMSPLLTMSSIESVHDLHFFFQQLLHRSSRTSMGSTNSANLSNTVEAKMTPSLLRRNTVISGAMSQQPAPPPSSSSAQQQQQPPISANCNGGRTSKGSKNASKQHQPQSSSSSAAATCGNVRKTVFPEHLTTTTCSLEELFINIDRIIANDFLETLPNNGTTNNSTTTGGGSNEN